MRKVADGERISDAQSEESPPASAQKQQCAPEHKAGGRASGGDALLKGLGVALPRGACAGERKLRAVGRNIHSHDISVVDAATEDRHGKAVLDLRLDEAAQRTCTKHGVISALGKPGTRIRSDREGQPAVAQPSLQGED